jgi:hypothetical protein
VRFQFDKVLPRELESAETFFYILIGERLPSFTYYDWAALPVSAI